MNKTVCIGECIVDFIPNDGRFVPTAGGAPANVCAGVSKLGGRGCFLGKLSKDAYGVFMLQNMKDCDIDVSYIAFDDERPTALSYVALDNGDRRFKFFRENTADLNFQPAEIPENLFCKGDVLHFCSVCLMESETKRAHEKAISLAKESGAYISLDVNLRPALWDDEIEMIGAVCRFLKFADIVKMSQEEADAICKYSGGTVGAETVFDIAENCKILILTKGKNGACAYDRDFEKVECAALNQSPVDTTGAGDCFVASILYLLCGGRISLDIKDMEYALRFASQACAIQVGRRGGMKAMPTLDEIASCKF